MVFTFYLMVTSITVAICSYANYIRSINAFFTLKFAIIILTDM